MIKTKLLEAENIAIQLFKTVEEKKLILVGKSEEELNNEIFNLAFEMFRIENHWHKKIVRSGENTLFPYNENPPNKILKDDDILFFDFGPIIENWEADLGRTYVIGNNSEKLKLKNDVEKAWYETKNWFDNQKTLKASELFAFVKQKANEFGWEFGGEIAGHLIGEYPHERLEPGNYQLYIHPENQNDMFSLDANGNERHWILEIHFVDRKNKIGGFFEQLLT
ncbi:hypothetical protein FEDK69T_30960 [Flavobacterium enshiense DK69]|uniref:Aminopeptidase n=1 Tax=Flavobacterium enshiense DK69 TaxID=1107311 RepID=V6S625_9FLAO|nr:M24 family metallopeptidase [Flavobacterium enshiense]ESU19840.1 hypothetical protein FEDK69T_30960 [Flavobacterium enshiense DK69]KGO93132.1 aminopeptidase [Flavobacterium enshiense DK69]